jgi:hypothetical protein
MIGKSKLKKDPISETDYDPWVYEFSKDNLPALDRSVNRTDKPAEYGWHPANQHPNVRPWGSYGSNSLHQRTKNAKDIGYTEGMINESVHEFASEDTNVLPLPWRRVKVPYANNGVNNPTW